MKRRTLTLTLCLLAFVALFSVGFAAWVVTSPINDVEPSGSITVSTVSDERVTLSAQITNAEIVFGKESQEKVDEYPYKWIILKDVPEENLQATVTLTITGFTYLKDININLTTALSETPNKPGVYKDTDYTNTGYQEALDAKFASEQDLAIQQNKNEAAIAKAEAEAQSILIAAEAQAKANELLTESLTNEILAKMYYEKWNGELPYFYGATDNALIQVPVE